MLESFVPFYFGWKPKYESNIEKYGLKKSVEIMYFG